MKQVDHICELFREPEKLRQYQKGLIEECPKADINNHDSSNYYPDKMTYLSNEQLYELIRSKKNIVLHCPDETYHHAAIPYLAGYFSIETKHVGNIFSWSVRDRSDTIVLFSWQSAKQHMGWISQIGNERDPPVVIGGSVVKRLDSMWSLESPLFYTSMNWFDGDLDFAGEFTKPNYEIIIERDPYTDILPVYSGSGCRWGNCRFCYEHIFNAEPQIMPMDYVAYCIEVANSFGKVAMLSSSYHTIPELIELEKHLKNKGNGPYSYCAYIRPEKDTAKQLAPYSPICDITFTLKHMRDAYIGIEYLSDSVLKRINKGITVKDIFATIKTLLTCGVNVYGNMITDLWSTEDEKLEHEENLDNLLRMIYTESWSCARFRLSQNVLF